MPDRPADRGQSGPRAITEFCTRLTRKPLGRRGFTEATLITEWAHIVGESQALGILPLKISFPPGERSGGSLSIRVVSGGLATEFHHREPLILQRINSYFGYGAVSRLKLTQGPVPPRPPPRPPEAPPILDPEQECRLQQRLSLVDDTEIREALARLGRRLAGRR